jgi:hypothetical protein
MTSRGSRAIRVVPGARHRLLAALLLASVLWGGAITGTKYALRAFDPVPCTLLSARRHADRLSRPEASAPRYPTDLTDERRAVLEPLLPVMLCLTRWAAARRNTTAAR